MTIGNSATSTTEEFFLRIFKVAILVIMALTLLVTVGAFGFAAYKYSQSPKQPAPAQKVPVQSVKIDEFLKQLESAPAKAEPAETPEEPKPESAPKPEVVKYRDEVKKIVDCYRESNKQAGIPGLNTGEEVVVVENFRRDLQRVADSNGADRGQPYAADAAKVSCELFLHPKLVSYRKANPNSEIFFRTINFHIKAWDSLKNEAMKFEEEEESRVKKDERSEAIRVAAAKDQAQFILIIAVGAFGLFMALALYLIMAAIESSMRRMSMSIEKIRLLQLPKTDLPTT